MRGKRAEMEKKSLKLFLFQFKVVMRPCLKFWFVTFFNL